MGERFGNSYPYKCNGCSYLKKNKVYEEVTNQNRRNAWDPLYVKREKGYEYYCSLTVCVNESKSKSSSSSSGSSSSRPAPPKKKNGYHVVNYTNGNRYEGNFANDLRSGRGKMFYSDGTYYEGYWENDKKNGKGYETFKSGATYEGDYADGARSGIGKITYSNGCYYEGEWKNDNKNGRGYETYNGGASYKGDFKDDKRCGYGVYKYPSGNVCEGEFRDDISCGWGKLTYPDGHYSMCMYRDDKKNGPGLITNNSGEILYIDFKDNKMEGWGICVLKDGTKKSSYYENNERTKYVDYEPGLYEPSSIPDLSTIRKRYHPEDQSSAPTENAVRTAPAPKPAVTAPAPKPASSATSTGPKPARWVFDEKGPEGYVAYKLALFYKNKGIRGFKPKGKAIAMLEKELSGSNFAAPREYVTRAVNCGAAQTVALMFKNKKDDPEIYKEKAMKQLMTDGDMSRTEAKWTLTILEHAFGIARHM